MAAPSAPIVGFNGKAYYNSGSYASPTWVLWSNVGDIDVTDERTKIEIAIRAGNGFKFTAPGLRDIGYSGKSLYDPGDTTQTALKTAYDDGTAKEFLFLDQAQATAGSAGLRALMAITKFARPEPIDGVMMIDWELKPAYTSNVPALYTAS